MTDTNKCEAHVTSVFPIEDLQLYLGNLMSECKTERSEATSAAERMFCDGRILLLHELHAMLDVVLQAVDRLKQYGVKPWRVFCYVLVQDIPSAERRVLALRDAGISPFAQPYRDFANNIEPSAEMRRFARWVNHKAIFKSVATFDDYTTRGV